MFFLGSPKSGEKLYEKKLSQAKHILKKYGVGKVGIRLTWTLANKKMVFFGGFFSFQRVAQTIGLRKRKNTQKERKCLESITQPRFVCF